MTDNVRTVAVVDDDSRLTESLENLFQSAGYAVRTFASGASLIEAGVAGVDCVVTDIGMPGMDGFQVFDRVKSMRPDLPVFFITGRHELGDQRRVSEREVAGVFRKPFDGQALLIAIGRVLGV